MIQIIVCCVLLIGLTALRRPESPTIGTQLRRWCVGVFISLSVLSILVLVVLIILVAGDDRTARHALANIQYLYYAPFATVLYLWQADWRCRPRSRQQEDASTPSKVQDHSLCTQSTSRRCKHYSDLVHGVLLEDSDEGKCLICGQAIAHGARTLTHQPCETVFHTECLLSYLQPEWSERSCQACKPSCIRLEEPVSSTIAGPHIGRATPEVQPPSTERQLTGLRRPSRRTSNTQPQPQREPEGLLTTAAKRREPATVDEPIPIQKSTGVVVPASPPLEEAPAGTEACPSTTSTSALPSAESRATTATAVEAGSSAADASASKITILISPPDNDEAIRSDPHKHIEQPLTDAPVTAPAVLPSPKPKPIRKRIIQVAEKEQGIRMDPVPLPPNSPFSRIVRMARLKPTDGCETDNVSKFGDFELGTLANSGARSLTIVKPGKLGPAGPQKKTWQFDRVLDFQCDNAIIFQTLNAFFSSYLDGDTVCTVADGISGAGKTYTLLKGPDALVPAVIVWLHGLRAREGTVSTICVRATQYYKNKRSDLVAIRNERKKSSPSKPITPRTDNAIDRIRTASEKTLEQNFDRDALVTWTLETAYDASPKTMAVALVKELDVVRQGRSTPENTESSRSHMIVEVWERDCQGHLVFADLCGLEDKDTSQDKEAADELKCIICDRAGAKEGMEHAHAEHHRFNSGKDSLLAQDLDKFYRPTEGGLRLLYMPHLIPTRAAQCCTVLALVTEIKNRTLFVNQRLKLQPPSEIDATDEVAQNTNATGLTKKEAKMPSTR